MITCKNLKQAFLCTGTHSERPEHDWQPWSSLLVTILAPDSYSLLAKCQFSLFFSFQLHDLFHLPPTHFNGPSFSIQSPHKLIYSPTLSIVAFHSCFCLNFRLWVFFSPFSPFYWFIFILSLLKIMICTEKNFSARVGWLVVRDDIHTHTLTGTHKHIDVYAHFGSQSLWQRFTHKVSAHIMF